eukprot:GHVS01104249.1.p1 GENE.GHVS01104249.1~~GHVS01104249.1.p1  ORF type:complete len:184 (+),score=0.99 GHVS01104249.1:81-632(+)
MVDVAVPCSVPRNPTAEFSNSTEESQDARADFLVQARNGQLITVDPDVLNGKHVGLFFGADWCPSCKSWLPNLVRFYNFLRPSNTFEVVYVPCDRTFDQYKRMVAAGPWYSLPFQSYGELVKKYDVRHLPSLVIVQPDDAILAANGVELLRDRTAGEKYLPIMSRFIVPFLHIHSVNLTIDLD